MIHMGNIEYKKTLTIKGKIIKEDDVLRIAHLLHSQFRTGDYTEEYEILFEDQSSLTGNDSVAILSSDEFRKRQSQRLWFTYKSKEFERRITVRIYNSFRLPTESTIEISSIDRDWYNSICNQMATIINEMEHQKITFSTLRKLYCFCNRQSCWVPYFFLVTKPAISKLLQQFSGIRYSWPILHDIDVSKPFSFRPDRKSLSKCWVCLRSLLFKQEPKNKTYFGNFYFTGNWPNILCLGLYPIGGSIWIQKSNGA